MIRGIHHVALHVRNWPEMFRFYTEALGFQPVSEPYAWKGTPAIDRAIGVPGSAARTVMLSAGNCFLEMFDFTSPASRDGQPLRPNDYGYTHFAVDVDDLEAEIKRLAAHGMIFHGNEPLHGDDISSVYGYDPDGNIIELQRVDDNHPFALRD